MARLIALRLLESYFRHRWLLLLPIILLLGIGIGYYFFISDPVYISRGVLYVQQDTLLATLMPLREETFVRTTPGIATADELDELMQTRSFIRSVIAQTDLEARMDDGPDEVENTIEEVRDAVWADAQGNNQVEIAAAWENPNIAYQLSRALVDSFIQWRINAAREESASAQSFFDELITDYSAAEDAARSALQEYLQTNPEPVWGDRPATEQLQVDRLESDLALARSRYRDVLEKEEDARLAVAQTESQVRRTFYLIDAPQAPTETATSLRQQVQNVAMFALMGVVLTVVGIVGGALLDRHPRFPLDVEHSTGQPVLAMVPYADPEEHPTQDRVHPADDKNARSLTGAVATE